MTAYQFVSLLKSYLTDPEYAIVRDIENGQHLNHPVQEIIVELEKGDTFLVTVKKLR